MVVITLNFSSELQTYFFYHKCISKVVYAAHNIWPLFFYRPHGPQRVKRLPLDAGMLC